MYKATLTELLAVFENTTPSLSATKPFKVNTTTHLASIKEKEQYFQELAVQ